MPEDEAIIEFTVELEVSRNLEYVVTDVNDAVEAARAGLRSFGDGKSPEGEGYPLVDISGIRFGGHDIQIIKNVDWVNAGQVNSRAPYIFTARSGSRDVAKGHDVFDVIARAVSSLDESGAVA